MQVTSRSVGTRRHRPQDGISPGSNPQIDFNQTTFLVVPKQNALLTGADGVPMLIIHWIVDYGPLLSVMAKKLQLSEALLSNT